MNVTSQYGLRGDSATAIAASVEAAVREGRLESGATLPTVRALASGLRVSPTTVAAAYRALRRRGVLSTDGRRGTRITARPPLAAQAPIAVPAHLRNLAYGNPDPTLLPPLRPALARLGEKPRLYGEPHNLPELLDVAARQFDADGIATDALAVMGGALDGVERVLQAHLRPGDRVAVEDPAYSAVLDLLGALGLEIEPVEIDDSGMLATALAGALRRGAKAVIVTPRAQNPTGAALDPPRVRALRTVLAKHPSVLVVEDDHAGAVAGAPALTLTEGRAHWAVVRSVAKSLGPDLRVAVVAGDPTTIARVEGRQQVGAGWVSHVLQRVVAALWKDRAVRKRLDDAAAAYTSRREDLLRALAAHKVRAHGRSGLNIWIPVAEEAAALATLAEAGFAARAGERYRIRSGPAIRITTATLAAGEAERIAKALAASRSPARRSAPA
jgi:DNA-binding transcriptional MocR family regulator